ncbi:hypothetical protein D9758_001270 [Tetrapyrgos nigripes]|uniref:NAD-dependent protein deacylase n=1 Tax=Tetrapyrgos nigripes TaxID=182062 RepID=A0A8H5GRS8_9AGAR|nr:hypothetical protein D9758_001270 [Tetrapyrgos nigripes]
MPPSNNVDEFRNVLKTSKHIIAVAGAGLSAASGIPTFRGAGGLWRRYDAMSLATPRAFNSRPSLVWQFYHYRRESANKAHLNQAHHSLASFSLPSIRHQIAPDSTFTLITQNVDGLSALALEKALESASDADTNVDQPKILEMHGRIFDVKCTECDHVEFTRASPICPALEGTENLIENNTMDPEIALDELPCCSKCGALARPGVVWFEEMPKYLDVINQIVDRADLCLVVGTSSTVYPAAGYAEEVAEHGGKVAVFNLDRSSGDDEADFLFLGPCEETIATALSV